MANDNSVSFYISKRGTAYKMVYYLKTIEMK